MKYENLMLKGLFTACLLVCLLTLGSMLTTHANSPTVAASQAQGTAVVQSEA